MAQSFASSALSIKRRFGQLLPAPVILHATVAAGHVWRQRKFDPVLTIHLFVLQILHGNNASRQKKGRKRGHRDLSAACS